MIISYAWLKELVDLPVKAEELADVLTFLGLEVEKTTTYTPSLENTVIGEVLECAHIEGTDHLTITQTRVGSDVLPIVCGAPNVRAGLKVVVMLPGAKTADGMVIKKAKLRGHESFGMLASERELGLVDEHAGIIEGDSEWEVGAPAAKHIDLPDTIFDCEVTPNRPDYLSHVGVARDLAAKFRLPWRWPEYLLEEIAEPAASQIAVEILAPDACPRYAARVVRGVKIVPSPFASRLRLIRCGVRPISNIVDITNLLMLEFGQPLHAFDMRYIEGKKIVVRYASEREKFVTLDGKEHELRSNDLLIADAKKGVALAGVMGGLNSEIREDTKDVIIECAYFDSVHVRRTARLLGFSTDASRRFERGMDPNGVPRVLDATAALMHSWGQGEVLSGRVDNYAKRIEPKQMTFRPTRATSVIGLDIPTAEMQDTLTRLGCEVRPEGNTWHVAAPTCRPDLEREIDLIEEVIRIHGYEEVPCAETSRVALFGSDDAMFTLRRKVVDVMVSLGFHETMALSMYTPDPRRDPAGFPEGIELKNPVTDDMLRLQGSLIPQLVRAAATNWQRGDRDLRMFEVARVFGEGTADDPRTWEHQSLAGLMTGQSYPQGWAHVSKPFDFFDLKGMLEVLTAKISLDKVEIICYDAEQTEVLGGKLLANGRALGKWGVWPTDAMTILEIDAPVGWFEIDLQAIADQRISERKYSPIPRFPISWRDIAIVVSETVSSAEILQTIRKFGGELLVKAEPFDVFRGEKLGLGRKSIAIRLEFSHLERSLESAEVDEWVEKIVQGLKQEHDASLR
ncbi:phenylalanine--tRNA ligase subunit beta [candidate division KSB1 bacterium]|nr:MAG: phenylalanine--tRNA ligase subunit beta [candidate division KSB1 bacterium]